VVAPVAAVLVVALVVGIVAVQNGGQMSATSDSGSGVALSSDGGAAPESSGESATKSLGTDQTTTSSPTLRERLADQLDRFAVVVLARAREVSGAVQKFAVLRIFKGEAPKVVELVVDDDPADRGRLHLLMLDPTAATPEVADEEPGATESPWPLAESPLPATESPWPETVSPEPIPSLAAADGLGEPLAVSYTYKGEPTMVREFPAGTDPGTVSLSIP
jgi:hypothetical protein